MYTHSLCTRGRVNWRIYHFKCVNTMSYVDADVCMRGCVHGHMHASMRMCVCVSVCMGTCMRVGLECVCGINSHTHTPAHTRPHARIALHYSCCTLCGVRGRGHIKENVCSQGKCVQPTNITPTPENAHPEKHTSIRIRTCTCKNTYIDTRIHLYSSQTYLQRHVHTIMQHA